MVPHEQDSEAEEEAMSDEVSVTVVGVPSRMEVVSIQPGDIVVIQYPERLSKQASINIHHGVSRALDLPPECKIIVLDAGMSLEVVRPEAPTTDEGEPLDDCVKRLDKQVQGIEERLGG